MSAYRLVLSVHAREEREPKRNLAAGKRLAPLPPGLRGRLRGTAANTSADGTRTDLTRAAPPTTTTSTISSSAVSLSTSQPRSSSSSSKTRAALGSTPPTSTRAGLHTNRNGRRYLPPVSPSDSSRGDGGASSAVFASTSPPVMSGRRSGPATAVDSVHSQRASNSSSSCTRESTNGSSPVTASSTPRTGGPCTSTSQSTRRPSPQRGLDDNVTPSNHPHRGATSASSTLSATAKSPAASSRSVASARAARQKPRAPVLSRTSARAVKRGSTAASRATSVVAVADPPLARTMCVTTNAAEPASTAAAGNGSAPQRQSTAGTAMVEVTAKAAAEPTQVNVRVEEIELPLAPHDMEEAFYRKEEKWRTEAELPPLVWSLLHGEALLEPPYTTFLWTQAYPDPAELLPLPAAAAAAPPNAKPSPAADSDALLSALQHRDGEKRRSGFYACVRCATPICSPAFQVVPAAPALRGIAVFHRLNLKGVDVHVRTTAVDGNNLRTKRCSLAPRTAANARGSVGGGDAPIGRGSEADAFLQSTSRDVQLIAHCRHCGGCLGVVCIGEAAVPRAASTFCALSASSSSSSSSGSAAGKTKDTVAQELLCVNSVCLRYMRYRTQAALDGELLGQSARVNAAEGCNRRSYARGMTVGALSSPPRQTAWGLQRCRTADGDDARAEEGQKGEEESGSDESTFGDLLNSLNPYSGGRGYDSDGGMGR